MRSSAGITNDRVHSVSFGISVSPVSVSVGLYLSLVVICCPAPLGQRFIRVHLIRGGSLNEVSFLFLLSLLAHANLASILPHSIYACGRGRGPSQSLPRLQSVIGETTHVSAAPITFRDLRIWHCLCLITPAQTTTATTTTTAATTTSTWECEW